MPQNIQHTGKKNQQQQQKKNPAAYDLHKPVQEKLKSF